MDLELCHVEKVIPINRRLRQAETKKNETKATTKQCKLDDREMS